MTRPLLTVLLGDLTAALAVTTLAAQPPSQGALSDPSEQEVPLACAEGWHARLLFDAGVGVWTVASFQVQPWLGCPEVVALDDRGRCTVLRSYSGKWTPQPSCEDGKWLAPVAHGDLDPTQAGSELYTGGQGGRLWQVVPRRSGPFESRVVAEWPGEEIHTLLLGDLDPTRDGQELLVFLMSGRWHVLSADATGVSTRALPALPGRVRQAVVLPARTGEAPWVATVSRTGAVALVRVRGTELEIETVAQEPMGFGRIARGAGEDGDTVLYVTRDDGVILRLAGAPGGAWAREVVMVGAQGPRGLVAGRFHEDPQRECLAVFGYAKKVVLLSRVPGGPWQSEVLFTDTDKGHWLGVAEVDGRNATDEIIGSGYGGRVFLLARPPGYGLPRVVVSPELGAELRTWW